MGLFHVFGGLRAAGEAIENWETTVGPPEQARRAARSATPVRRQAIVIDSTTTGSSGRSRLSRSTKEIRSATS